MAEEKRPRAKILHALASCRRVLLLSLLGLCIMAAAFWMQAPSLDTLRPQIETYLKQQLNLKRLQLGELSWYWAGYLWLQSDRLDFATRDERASFEQGSVAVRISLFSLLQRRLMPDQIRLSHGRLDLRLPELAAHTGESPPALMPGRQLRLEDVDLTWRYHDLSGRLGALHLLLDGDKHLIRAQAPQLQFSARLDDDGLPASLSLQCQHGDWLPKPIRGASTGKPMLRFDLQRKNALLWMLKARLASEQEAVLLPDSIHSLPFESIAVKAELRLRPAEKRVQSPKQSLELQVLRIQSISWKAGQDSIQASGLWQDGRLSLQAFSEQLRLHRIWSALRPLGGPTWHQWLASMHAGTASNVNATMQLPWDNPLSELPFGHGMQGVSFHVRADVSGAELALGTGPDRLQQIEGQVEIDEKALQARIDDALLPHQLGHSAGTLTIPWDSLELQIDGHGQIELERLLAWRGPPESRNWAWQQSLTDASYKVRWRVSEPEPRHASAELQPIGAWQLSVAGIPVRLTSGDIHWDHHQGIVIREAQVSGERMQGTLSLSAGPDAEGRWHFKTLQAQGEADLARMSAYFQLPLSHPSGIFSLSLNLDPQKGWTGTLDLSRSRWDHLLGSSKNIGQAFEVSYAGELVDGANGPILKLNRIHSSGEALSATGTAQISNKGLHLDFDHIKTPAFDGRLKIRAPIGMQPWEMDVHADYLNRKALPESIEYARTDKDKPWALRARIKRFDWDDARMSGVHLQLASRQGSTGVFEASQVHTSRLDVLDVSAMFALLGNGEIDLRRLTANVEKQRLEMSARLLPEAGGGMRWQGFARVEGDFGHLMQRAGLSQKFSSGIGRMLFSGQGIVLREQPWWQGLDGRLRLRVDQGRILEGGSLTRLLSAMSLADLPKLLVGQRKDLTGEGILFKRLQMEAIMTNQIISVHNLAMRSTAFDLAGHGSLDIDAANVDMYLIVHPLQNLDAILARIPLLRDILGGRSHSFYRKVYRMHGPLSEASVEQVSPEQAGLAGPGLIEGLLSLPEKWFGSSPGSATP